MARPRTACSARGRASFLAGLFLLVVALPVPVSPGEATAQTSPAPAGAASPSPPAVPAPVPSPARESPPTAIPVAEVATRAAEVTNLLRELTTQLAPSAASEAIRKGIPELREQIDQDLETTGSILEGQPSLDVLQAQQQLWQRRQLQATEWLTALTHRATLLQAARPAPAPLSSRLSAGSSGVSSGR